MSDVVEKWGKSVAERGFVQIPTYLLNINRFLGEEYRLTPVELLVVFQLVGNWWKKEEDPFPAIATLASRCGVSTRQVQRAINRLDEMNIIQRSKRRRGKLAVSNSYSLKPLVTLLEEVSKAFPNEYPRKVTKEDRKKIKENYLEKELNSSVSNINIYNNDVNIEYLKDLPIDEDLNLKKESMGVYIKYHYSVLNVINKLEIDDTEKEKLHGALLDFPFSKRRNEKSMEEIIKIILKKDLGYKITKDDINKIENNYNEIEKIQSKNKIINKFIPKLIKKEDTE